MKKLIALSLITFATAATAVEYIDGTCGEPVSVDIDVAMYDEAYVNNLPATASGNPYGELVGTTKIVDRDVKAEANIKKLTSKEEVVYGYANDEAAFARAEEFQNNVDMVTFDANVDAVAYAIYDCAMQEMTNN